MPGKFVEIRDFDNFTTFTGDAKNSYTFRGYNRWLWNGNYLTDANFPITTNITLRKSFFNDSLSPTNSSYFDRNLKSAALYNPVLKAFRSVAMIRGKRPFVVVVDDIQKDFAVHNYDWTVNTFDVDRLRVDSARTLAGNGKTLVLCAGPCSETAGQARLLVQVLDSAGKSNPAPIIENALLYVFQQDGTYSVANFQRIVISALQVVQPNFKILLYPFRVGDPLPTVVWINDVVNVTFSDFQTFVRFNYSDLTQRTTIERLDTYNPPKGTTTSKCLIDEIEIG